MSVLYFRYQQVLNSRKVGLNFLRENFMDSHNDGFGYQVATMTEPCYSSFWIFTYKKYWLHREGTILYIIQKITVIFNLLSTHTN